MSGALDDSNHDDTFEAQITQIGAGLSLPRVPSELHERLVGLFDAHGLDKRATQLVLLSDSRTSRPLVGTRGAGDVAGYTLRFSSSDGIDLVVDVSNSDASEGLVDVHGLILGTEARQASLAESAGSGGKEATEASVDELGRFGFGGVSSGSYELALSGGPTPLVVAIDLGEGDQ